MLARELFRSIDNAPRAFSSVRSQNFVQEYIDIILLGAVTITLIPTVWHYISSVRKAKRSTAAGADQVTDAEEAAALALDPDVFDSPHDK